MHSAVEFVVKNVTEEMQAAELWDNSVFVRTIRHDKRCGRRQGGCAF